MTVTGTIPLSVNLTSTSDADTGREVLHLTNTKGFSIFLLGEVLAPGKLLLDVTLVPMNGGVIIDATMSVKLRKVAKSSLEIGRIAARNVRVAPRDRPARHFEYPVTHVGAD